MKHLKLVSTVFIILTSIASPNAADPKLQWRFFNGMCDASALEMLDHDRFVVGNDEDNILRIYSRSRGGAPIAQYDFGSYFAPKKKRAKPGAGPETDLEGSARIGDVIYWISSHGANASGKVQPTRRRFFATRVHQTTNGPVQLAPIGRLYTDLLLDLSRDPQYSKYKLGYAAEKAPKVEGALNIEGMAVMPDGAGLYIGFRNPIPNGAALIAPLLNPSEIIQNARARFGPPILLDLQGRGIRSIISHQNGYLVVGGSSGSGGPSQLFQWDGKSTTAKTLTPLGLQANPEAMAILKDNATGKPLVFAVSDDGTETIAGQECKRLKNDLTKTFRAYEFALD